ncbi:hypothetical protein BCON_0039g00430 [Botryotinia convoluta]|uniref:Uncharacterized protein n=1 Tax=Botryotinia convoluta TaxID=54673 RepID=A0A4Z1IKH3_9HELO|nr:hypothetical protein BCON_0039g00430 [Botryotinia convoluta]
MTFPGLSTTKKVKGIKSSIQEDIRRPLALLSQNINRAKPTNESPSSYITNESKKAISVLINQHEQAKSELENHKSSESKMKNEVEELRTQIQELHDTIKHDQDDLKQLNQLIEGGIQGSSTLPDTEEALLEKLIAREAVIDREIFNLRDDKVISRAELWFAAVGRVDESIVHPDQASRDRNLAMRKEMYIRTKRSIAQDTKAALLSTKEEIQKQKLEILRDDSVEGHVPFAPPSPISMDNDQVSFVTETPLDDPFVENAPQNRNGSWATINGEESSNVPSRIFSEDNRTVEDNHRTTLNREESSNVLSGIFDEENQTAENSHRATIEENRSLRLQIQTTERKIQEWEGNFDRFKLETQATIERLASEISFSEDSLQEYKNALEDADEVRGQLVHDLAQIEEEKDRLCVIVEEVGLPILARNAENMKRIKRDGAFTSLGNRHLPFNEILVHNGNYAATGGHIDAHLASILLCEKEIVSGPVISHEMFLNMYGVSVGEYRHLYKVSDRLDEMFNMHAMLVESGSFTEMTLSETRDSLFQSLFTLGLLQFDTIEAPNAVEKGRIFDSQDGEDQIETFNEMLEIVQDIKRMQRDAKLELASEQSVSEQSVSEKSSADIMKSMKISVGHTCHSAIMRAQVLPPGTTSTALVVSKPQNKDGLTVKDLISKFKQLRREVIDRCGRQLEEKIQRTFPEKEKVFIDYLSSKYSKMVDNTNKDIQEINAKLGLNLPLEKPKEISASHVDENNLRFITAERERNAIQKEHLKKNFEEFNLEVSTLLEISPTETTSSLTRPTEIPDDTVNIAQLLEDSHSLQNELEVSKQTAIKLEAEKKQDKTTIAILQTLNDGIREESATLKEELKQLKEKIPHYKVIANSCSRVRHGLFHAGRCFRDDDGFHDIEGRAPADRKVNDSRNDACHKGDIATDYALFMVDPNRAGWNIGGERYVDFTNSYCVTPHEWAKIVSLSEAGPDRVLLEVLNSHGTMYRCYFNAEHSHSEVDDLNFNVSFAKLFAKYKYLLASTNLPQAAERYQALVNFVKQVVNDRRGMEEIVRRTVAREKARLFRRA